MSAWRASVLASGNYKLGSEFPRNPSKRRRMLPFIGFIIPCKMPFRLVMRNMNEKAPQLFCNGQIPTTAGKSRQPRGQGGQSRVGGGHS